MFQQTDNLFSQGVSLISIILVIAVALISFFLGRFSSTASPTKTMSAQQPAPQALAHKEINKTFSFPVTDQNNNVITQLKYNVQSADLMNQIIVKGQPATTIKGKEFLIINLRLDNSSDKSIAVNTRDYIRLTANNNGEQLAPEVHNDPVEIQPISTKLTRVGFTINTTDKNLILHVGQINGNKTDIPLSF